MKKYYAHSLPGRPPEEWQPMEEHLKSVAEMATGLRRNSVVKGQHRKG